MNRIELVARFLEKAALAGAGAVEVSDAAALRRAVAALLPEGEGVYSPALSALELAATQGVAPLVADYAEARISVEEVMAGIAETGSIVCASVEGRAVQASLLPSHHIAILTVEKIYDSLEDFFDSLKSPPTNLAIITGPSRTADIELTLAIGVHGPERVDILVVAPPHAAA